jgi:hypothetical protein
MNGFFIFYPRINHKREYPCVIDATIFLYKDKKTNLVNLLILGLVQYMICQKIYQM